MTVTEYCKRKRRSETTLKLIDKLKNYSIDDDYILGILALSQLDEDRQLIIDFIEQNKTADYESIIILAIEIAQRREQRSTCHTYRGHGYW